jgi:hypothetical protein
MQDIQSPLVALHIMAQPGDARPEHGEQQNRAPDIIAVIVHEASFIAVDVSGGAGVRGQCGILVGVRLLDLRSAQPG